MNIGTRIHFYRLKKNMSEEELVNGITTAAYLSSIENNENIPPIELMSELCGKLNIPFICYPNEKLRNLLEEWKRCLLLNQKDQADTLYQKISEIISDHDDINLIFTYYIYCIRYHLLFQHFSEARKLIEQFKPFQFEMPDPLKFAYQKHCGYYLYCHSKFIEAAAAFEHAKKYLISVETHIKEEQADLYYMYGLALSRIRKNSLTIYYIEEALSLFQRTYQLKRCADCHLLLGLTYRHLQDYKEAASHYRSAKELAVSIDYTEILPKINNNLGILKSHEGYPNEAITFYLESLNSMKQSVEETEDKLEYTLDTILNIIKEYFMIGCIEEVKKWLVQGFHYIHDNDHFKQHFIELTFYQYVADGYPSGFDTFVLETAIPYFEKVKKYHLIILFSKTLGDYYLRQQCYKDAAETLAIANSAYEKVLTI